MNKFDSPLNPETLRSYLYREFSKSIYDQTKVFDKTQIVYNVSLVVALCEISNLKLQEKLNSHEFEALLDKHFEEKDEQTFFVPDILGDVASNIIEYINIKLKFKYHIVGNLKEPKWGYCWTRENSDILEFVKTKTVLGIENPKSFKPLDPKLQTLIHFFVDKSTDDCQTIIPRCLGCYYFTIVRLAK